MLTYLHIKNLALLQDISLEFGPGLTVITGESGSGKTMLISALSLLLGARAKSSDIRTGCEKAVVEAVFDLERDPSLEELLESQGILWEDELVIRRVLSNQGRSQIFLNQQRISLQGLKNIAINLCEICSQHEFHRLADSGFHTNIMDQYLSNLSLLAQVKKDYQLLHDLLQQREELLLLEKESQARQDYLEYQLQEIERVNPLAGEDLELDQKKALLSSAEKRAQMAMEADNALYSSEESILGGLYKVLALLDQLSNLDENLQEMAKTMSNCYVELEEIARDLNSYGQKIEYDQGELDRVEERIFTLNQLKRKFGGSLEEVFLSREKMVGEKEKIEALNRNLTGIDRQIEEQFKIYREKADSLSHQRGQVTGEFSEQLKNELVDLKMPDVQFQIEFKSHPKTLEGISPGGWETLQFLISTNRGEEPKPLAQVASGGEMSRILLAFKNLLRQRDPVSTYVFDEVDAGIGGEMANRVAKKLSTVSQEHQVICVTHSPQIAARGNSQYRVIKQLEGERTVTSIIKLEDEDRNQEIAALMGSTGKISLRHAAALREEVAKKLTPRDN